jgi:hypothetical protein
MVRAQEVRHAPFCMQARGALSSSAHCARLNLAASVLAQQPRCLSPCALGAQATPLVAGLTVAAAAYVGKQALQTYIKLASSSGGGSFFKSTKTFYKVSHATHGGDLAACMHPGAPPTPRLLLPLPCSGRLPTRDEQARGSPDSWASGKCWRGEDQGRAPKNHGGKPPRLGCAVEGIGWESGWREVGGRNEVGGRQTYQGSECSDSYSNGPPFSLPFRWQQPHCGQGERGQGHFVREEEAGIDDVRRMAGSSGCLHGGRYTGEDRGRSEH